MREPPNNQVCFLDVLYGHKRKGLKNKSFDDFFCRSLMRKQVELTFLTQIF